MTPRPLDEPELIDLRRRLMTWFDAERRELPWRGEKDPYRIWVSEVMLQQTQVQTVITYYRRFVDRYPNVAALARAALEDVLKSWEGMGYYARARNLRAAAETLVASGRHTVPRDLAEFRALPGVGEYIAAAVMSIAFDHPLAVVDGNVTRVVSRLFAIATPLESAATRRETKRWAQVLLDTARPGDFNQAMMELGATVCRPRRPSCEACALSPKCRAFATARQEDFPVRRKRKPVPKYHIAVGVIQKDERVLITRRRESGLLGGLWEFPGGKVAADESPEDACRREVAEEVNLEIEVTDYLTHVEHAYSHFKIGVDVYACRYVAGDIKLQGPIDYRWILVEELGDYAFPGANRKFLPIVKERFKRTPQPPPPTSPRAR